MVLLRTFQKVLPSAIFPTLRSEYLAVLSVTLDEIAFIVCSCMTSRERRWKAFLLAVSNGRQDCRLHKQKNHGGNGSNDARQFLFLF